MSEPKFSNWLKSQWQQSLAKEIYDSLTPLGRVVLWMPIWLFCWLVAVPLLLVVIPIALGFDKVFGQPLGWLGQKLFK